MSEIQKKQKLLDVTPKTNNSSARYIPKKVIVFDLIGPLAHFQNIQTNSTSLTYFFPPPTTIYGLIAGIAGFPFDSYYELFSPSNTFLAIDILSPIRKELHTINYRVYTEPNYTQIPLEVIFPNDNQELRYRIFFAINHQETYSKILNLIRENRSIFPPYLGLSEFIAQIEFLCEADINEILPSHCIESPSIIAGESYTVKDMDKVVLFPEYMRTCFTANRVPGLMKKYFYKSKGSLKLSPKIEGIFFYVNLGKEKQPICRL